MVSQIPRGHVLSYKEVAIRAGFPRTYRAVGNIMAGNYDSSVPCHRVVRSDGSLGDYNRGGVTEKKRKLENEGVTIVNDRVFV